MKTGPRPAEAPQERRRRSDGCGRPDGRRNKEKKNVAEYQNLLVETHGAVTLVRLNRPKVLNALNTTVGRELADLLQEFDLDPEQRCAVLTGSDRAFAAGADISEMQQKHFADMYDTSNFGVFDRIAAVRKPVIAAVAGFALGGGCELAMMCDFILAAPSARFGQPEVKLGIGPGMGGSQRLTRAVGKAKAMEMILTGRMMDAEEAERAGLVSRIVPADVLVDEALKVAQTIAGMPPLAVKACKEMVNFAHESTLASGIRFERRLFHSLFATDDQTEGMSAFVEKRPGRFIGH